MKIKVMKIALIAVTIVAIVVPLFSCGSGSTTATTSTSQVKATRGDLTTEVTAAGNLALALTEDLPFDLFYGNTSTTVATVAEVLVEEGDIVTKGQKLASVDISQWNEELANLEVTLATKKRDLTQKQLDLITAQQALEDAEAKYIWPTEIFTARQKVYTYESAVDDAKAVLSGSKLVWDSTIQQYRVQEAKTAYDIRLWTEKLMTAEANLATARLDLDKLLAQYTAVTKVANAQEKLRLAQAELDRFMNQSTQEVAEGEQTTTVSTPSGVSTSVTSAQAEKIATQKVKVEMAQEELKNAQTEVSGVSQKRLSVELAQGKLDDAKRAVNDAQKTLDEAKAKSPYIIAPFDGFITAVNVVGGDEIKTGTVAMTIADTNKFEVEIPVSETDIMQVKLGQDANVRVDAMSSVSLSANVTHISPTATISSGVVNYKVKVEVAPLTSIAPRTSSGNATGIQRPSASGNISSSGGPRFQMPSGGSGNVSSSGGQRFQRPSGSGNTSSGMPQFQPGQLGGQTTLTVIPENFQLKQGMTVIVNLVVQQKNDIVMVPSTAITSQGMRRFVNVSKADGTTENRQITTGISNGQYTEVLSGLSEGDTVVVSKKSTSTSSTTTSQQQRPPGMMIPIR
ncbi:MAG: HlyD family efflux transporter periplasmic adaptor subunit [Chloroflexota bacterium]